VDKFPNHQSDKNPGNHKSVRPMIMVVDDEVSVLKMTELILEGEGYQVEPCSTGKEVVGKFNKSINAVVLDISMPDMTGLQVFEIIKEKNPYVPIIFHTGSVTRSDNRRDIRRQFRPHALRYKGK